MSVTASELRRDVYRLLDRVLASGEPLEVERHGQLLRIVPLETGSRLGRLSPMPGLISGDPGDLAELDWSGNWQP